eukprot:316576-Amphidinium_carterae.1
MAKLPVKAVVLAVLTPRVHSKERMGHESHDVQEETSCTISILLTVGVMLATAMCCKCYRADG